MTKRITLTITGNIESIKKQLQDEHGVEFSYAQVVDLLINFYRKRNKPETKEYQKFFKGHITSFAAFNYVLTEDEVMTISSTENFDEYIKNEKLLESGWLYNKSIYYDSQYLILFLVISSYLKMYRDRHKFLNSRVCSEIRLLPPIINSFRGGIEFQEIMDNLENRDKRAKNLIGQAFDDNYDDGSYAQAFGV